MACPGALGRATVGVQCTEEVVRMRDEIGSVSLGTSGSLCNGPTTTLVRWGLSLQVPKQPHSLEVRGGF